MFVFPVLRVMEVDDGGEGPAEDPEARARRPPVHPLAQAHPRQPPHAEGHQRQEQQLGEIQGTVGLFFS